MEFLKKLFGRVMRKAEPEGASGLAPLQSQAEQDATRARTEEEVTGQRARREAPGHTERAREENGMEAPKE
jgi:hypothetical protein